VGLAHDAVVPGCAVIGTAVFSTYALVFSTATARAAYARTRRALEGCLAVVFGVAGIRLLAWSSTTSR
jgi:threonine/homoserine/homoserine lactone efflux protein